MLCDDDGDKGEGETFLSSAMIILLCYISRVLYVEVAVFSQSFRSFVLDPFQPLARLPPDLFSARGAQASPDANRTRRSRWQRTRRSESVERASERVVWDSQIFVIIFGKQNRANYH